MGDYSVWGVLEGYAGEVRPCWAWIVALREWNQRTATPDMALWTERMSGITPSPCGSAWPVVVAFRQKFFIRDLQFLPFWCSLWNPWLGTWCPSRGFMVNTDLRSSQNVIQILIPTQTISSEAKYIELSRSSIVTSETYRFDWICLYEFWTTTIVRYWSGHLPIVQLTKISTKSGLRRLSVFA